MSEYINNQTQRQETLKGIIRQLHAGASVEDVKAQFAELLAGVGGDEIAHIEQALVAEGLEPEQIKPLCDVHVAVFRESLDDQTDPQTIPGHPVFTFRAENLAVGRVLDSLRAALDDVKADPSAATLRAAREKVLKLREYERHYLRKENILFSYLERYDFSGPSKVMWAVHDDIRAAWKKLGALLDVGPGADNATFSAQIEETFTLLDQTIRDMIYKEHKILFPAAMARLSEKDWGEIRAQEGEIGYCYVTAGRQWQARRDPREAEAKAESTTSDGLIPLNVGALSAEQISMMLSALPVDITFVDEQDEVRFFSQTRERVFPRSPAIIGRKVQNCHPPQSMGRVQRILDDFRAGVRDVAEFWISLHGMFVHIRYFALRDAAGAYRGTIEVTQNIAPLRALEGERRLLNEGA
ncbi:MAG TPA: DUF438 domain-containing protein [Anaerolineae bacterium]|nr:DUF438 domain-containing protein [Anaerolineae bacterium]HQI84157.1 DUF438 domain-containing protein [Anaerolineae bacterium]